MSVQAMAWALHQREVTNPSARHVLLCLANYAHDDGTASFPSSQRIAEDTGMSKRTVQRKIDELLASGVLKLGNQAIAAAHISRNDRRPVVYDLIVSRGDTVTPRSERGDILTPNGVTLTTERGDTVSPNPLKKNHKKENQKKARASSLPIPDGVKQQTWDDWHTLRKAKKAPVTATVVKRAEAEAKKAGLPLTQFLEIWCARGSQGLEAEWLKPNERAGAKPASGFALPENRL